MPIKTEDYDEEDEAGLYVLIKITYTPKYPEELPILELEDCVNIDDYNLRDELTAHLTQQVSLIRWWYSSPKRLKNLKGGTPHTHIRMYT